MNYFCVVLIADSFQTEKFELGVIDQSVYSVSVLELSWWSVSSSSVISSLWNLLNVVQELAVFIEEVLSGGWFSPEVRSQEVVGLLQGVEDGLGEVTLGLGRSGGGSVDVFNSGELENLL